MATPNIKDIDASGAGDYSTLSAWESYASSQASAHQWARVWDRGDVGVVVLDGWTGTPSEDEYPKIYPAENNGHNGNKDPIGAFVLSSTASGISAKIDYTQIIGMRFDTGDYAVINLSAEYCLVDACLIRVIGGPPTDSLIDYNGATSDAAANIWRNNLGCSANSNANNFLSFINQTAGTRYYKAYNNTITGANGYGWFCYTDATSTSNVTLENNLFIDNWVDMYTTGGGTFNITANYNTTADATGDDWGGTGNEISVSSSDLFVDSSRNYRLAEDSSALDSGTAQDFHNDIISKDGEYMRPQGRGWDRGAFEASVYQPQMMGC